MDDEFPQAEALAARAAAGDAAAWGTLLSLHHDRLCRIVGFRMDRRLRGRIDPADVVQEALVEATAHRDSYFRTPEVPLFLWLRGVVTNKLLELHRQHLRTRMRDVKRERRLDGSSDETTDALCGQLTGGLTRPSVAAVRREARTRLWSALAAMEPVDREVLALRHFEQLTSTEAAKLLGIQERAAAKRYLRALARLRQMLAEMPGGLTELRP